MRFYTGAEDCAWLRETALRGLDVPTFASFTLRGNEDCPEVIELYTDAEPSHDDWPIARYTLTDDLSYVLAGK